MNSKPAKRIKAAFAVLLAAVTAALLILAAVRIEKGAGRAMVFYQEAVFVRVPAEEEPDEDLKKYPVEYMFLNGDIGYTLEITYSPEEYEALPENASVTGHIYGDGRRSFTFDHPATDAELHKAQRALYASEEANLFGIAMACLLTAVGLAVVLFFGRHFTDYEQIWFLSILVLAAIFSLLFPEEEANGVNGLVIMALYLLDTFLNILCELLISKQSKWNFIVSVFVEITEIVICIVLMYRFATMATTLFFWLPCDILSFINWHRHPDKQEEELTVVRTLKGWQEALIIAGIVVWTVVVGYFLSHLDFLSDFIQNRTLEVVIAYLDACASAVGVVNGVFILLRLREQWIAWYICAALESAINVLSGQFVLLVLKLGYFTNTTYGYIKWTKYIKSVQKKEIED
ncbi:MAG: nicotinamide mononucleotide transporter [Clostridia bacterium]|nr:nicotinamide mononucleotide transporter [Clostridia bacterium]